MKNMDDVIWGIAAFLVVVAMMFPYAILFMIAWNFVLPPVFNFPQLDYWQAFAILFIFNMIMPYRLIGHRHD